MVSNIILFVVYSLLGALAYRLIWSKTVKEFTSYDTFRHLAIGCIIGVIYYSLYSEYNFPNSIMAFVAGWMGVDFLDALISKIQDLLGKKRS